MTECFRCGQEGHHRRDCPQDAKLPAVRAAGAEAPRARAKDCDVAGDGRHSKACREGNRKACSVDWCQCQCHGERPEHRTAPEFPAAATLLRDPSEICPPERMHEIAQDVRNSLFGGMPRWLTLRMRAWHQVTASRQSRFSLPEPAKQDAPDGAPSADVPSPSGSSSGSFLDSDGLTPAASSNGHAP